MFNSCLWSVSRSLNYDLMSQISFIARSSSLLTHAPNLWLRIVGSHSKGGSEIWQTLYGRAAQQPCLQPLGWMVARKANYSRVESLSRSSSELEQAQLRKEKLLSLTQCCRERQDSSTHDFHNFLGVKRELRMENQQGRGNMKWVCMLSKYKSKLDSIRHCPQLCSTGEAGEENQTLRFFLEAGGAEQKEG